MIGGSIRWYEEVYKRYPSGYAFVLTQKTEGWEEFDAKYPVSVVRTTPWGHSSLHHRYAKIYWEIYRRAKFLIQREGLVLVHCDIVLPAGLIGYFLKLTCHFPYILYAHGEEITLYRQLKPEKYIIPLIYKKAKAIIVNSRFTRQLLLEMGVSPSQIHLIHPGVDTNYFRPNLDSTFLREKHDLKDKKIVLTISRLQERKGQDFVIQAMPKVLKQIPNAHYLIVGDGEEHSRLEKMVRELNLEKHVTFTGFVDEDVLPYYYNLADVFILANRETETKDIEGFGMVFIEANACGKPVIGGRTGGAVDAIIDGVTGFLIDPTNVNAISQKIVFLLTHPHKAEEMGKQGRERAVREFQWDNIAKRIQGLG